jgi:phosphoribosyl-dephospho-CoA transferase
VAEVGELFGTNANAATATSTAISDMVRVTTEVNLPLIRLDDVDIRTVPPKIISAVTLRSGCAKRALVCIYPKRDDRDADQNSKWS